MSIKLSQDLKDVNNNQLLAISHINGPMMVIAGPGSGKTFVITRRIKNLINSGINPENILVITFTKASAIEMEERFHSLLKDNYYPVTFGTFHAIYYSILKENNNYQNYSIITEREKYRYLKDIISMTYEDNTYDLDSIADLLLSDISKIKNNGLQPSDLSPMYLPKEIFMKIYKEYSEVLTDNMKIDFDDMVLDCYKLLKDNSGILNNVRQRFKYILIDEFQDINKLQFKIIKMIAYPANNLFIVGDDDQSIYGFRGSRPDIMLNLKKDYKNLKKVVLTVNYRSSPDIVKNAVEFIENNHTRFKKKIQSQKKANLPIVVKGFSNKNLENDYIIRIINTYKRNNKLDDIAILYRTNNEAKYITKQLHENSIPYNFKEKPSSFFKSYIAKDILSILGYANHDYSNANLLRFMNKPVRYIKRSMLNNIITTPDELLMNGSSLGYVYKNIKKLIYDLNTIKEMNIYSAISYIRKNMGYEKHILNQSYNKSEDKEIINLIHECTRNLNTLKEFIDYIEEYDSSLENSNVLKDNAINIVTMHGSKGLEYNTVIIPEINEGYIPSKKTKNISDIEEERRVFYVAMTRAKERLYLTYVNNKEQGKQKSRFLYEIKAKDSSS